MLRVLLSLALLALTIYAAVDCIQTHESEVRYLPKILWVLLILVLPIVAPISWLLAGRSRRVVHPGPGQAQQSRALAPDDDPEFLANLERRSNAAHEKLLEQWEADLRRREEELRRRAGDHPNREKHDKHHDKHKDKSQGIEGGKNKPATPSEGSAPPAD